MSHTIATKSRSDALKTMLVLQTLQGIFLGTNLASIVNCKTTVIMQMLQNYFDVLLTL